MSAKRTIRRARTSTAGKSSGKMLNADLMAKIAKLPRAEQLWLADQFELEACAIRRRLGGIKQPDLILQRN